MLPTVLHLFAACQCQHRRSFWSVVAPLFAEVVISARVRVFCKNSVAGLTPTLLVDEVRDADLMTLAEVLEMPGGEAATVKAMLKHFRLEHDDANDIDGVELHLHAKHRSGCASRWRRSRSC